MSRHWQEWKFNPCWLATVFSLKTAYPFDDIDVAVGKALWVAGLGPIVRLWSSFRLKILERKVKRRLRLLGRAPLPEAAAQSKCPIDPALLLPPEVLSQIIRPLPRVKQLRLLNTRWSQVLSPHVFRSLALKGRNDITAFLKGEEPATKRGVFVSNLKLWTDKDGPVDEELLLAVLTCTPNLKVLHLANMLTLSSSILSLRLPQHCLRLQHLTIQRSPVSSSHSWKEVLRLALDVFSPMRRRRHAAEMRRITHSRPRLVYDIQTSNYKSSCFGLSLSRYQHLSELDLSGNDFNDLPAILIEIAVVCGKRLNSLRLRHCKHVVGLVSIVDLCPRLKTLDLSYSDVEALELGYLLKSRRNCPVQHLFLAGCAAAPLALSLYDAHILGLHPDFTAATLMEIETGLPPLLTLDLSQTRLENIHVLIVGLYFPDLKSLCLRENRWITHGTVSRLIRRCSDLVMLDVTDCSNVGRSVLLSELSSPVQPPPLAFSARLEGRSKVLQVLDIGGENIILEHIKLVFGVLTLALIVLSSIIHAGGYIYLSFYPSK
ncbi:hypothetical protein DFS34DRAFT_648681 [Phlyctochytrium arcticum]|nr:hypothetical protein DFS34DRAFT_648681 [Phlyctochytrium arcticum]